MIFYLYDWGWYFVTHYICTGNCEGVAEDPGDCQSPDCIKFGDALVPCNCIDGKHDELKKKLAELSDTAIKEKTF